MQLVAGQVAVVTSHSVSLRVEGRWSQGRGRTVFWTQDCLNTVSAICVHLLHWSLGRKSLAVPLATLSAIAEAPNLVVPRGSS